MKQIVLTLLIGSYSLIAVSQEPEKTDSSKTLQEVVIKAYEQNKQLKEVSAAVNYIGPSQLERFSNTSILPALNTTPGVRMEERSPGSYRLNIRGSTLRSAFGVRNVKVYWNDIPLTDPGGNTYLNGLSYYNINSIEVIKGPTGSLYGAGTGGAILIHSQPANWQRGVDLSFLRGSYNLNSFDVQVRAGGDDHRNLFGYSHQNSDGYRDHTNMRRDIASWETLLKASDRQTINAYLLYSDLYYQTPGGLTKAEYTANPRAARPTVGATPGAVQAQAAIFQKIFIAGIASTYHFNDRFSNTTSVYGASTQLKNPTFRNYEIRTEPHFGGRSTFSFNTKLDQSSLRIIAGAEAQKGFFNTEDFGNRNGLPDTVQTNDNINNWTWSVFAQADLKLPGDWTFTAGASLNKSYIGVTRLSIPQFKMQQRTYSNEWAPRVALSKKINRNILVYGSIAKGFSPPSQAEVLPSTGVISTNLEAEHGLDYEVGIKSSWLQERLYIEANWFYYHLQNAIVDRRDSTNADYYINAGSTMQAGFEGQAYYQLLPNAKAAISSARVFISYTNYGFYYHDFKQATIDYSGNRLPSVPHNTIVAGIDMMTDPGFYCNITWQYTDPIPLNDANTDFASSYQLMSGRIGWRKAVSKYFGLDIFGGVDNLFDINYSLGNDINAAGGRYYNAAPGVNYFGAATLKFKFAGK
jgi:iron complex outermembrane receptor protein